MMKTDLYQTLMSGAADPRLSRIVADAIEFLKRAVITGEHGPSGNGQPANQVSDLHAFRKRSGYYKDGAVVGLDETIESLALAGKNVRLGVIETNQGAVALWLDEHSLIVGLMITKIIAKES
jgi:hypothetical protein